MFAVVRELMHKRPKGKRSPLSSGRRCRGSQRDSSRSLIVEPLEQRCLLTIFTWSGASLAGQNWTDKTNWVGDVAPQANQGDSLSFPGGVSGLNPVNDFPDGSSFASIDISGAGYTFSTVGSNSVKLQTGLTNEEVGNTVNLNFSLGASQEFANTSGSTLVIGGNINLGANTLTIGGSYGETDLNGVISGTGGLLPQRAAAGWC